MNQQPMQQEPMGMQHQYPVAPQPQPKKRWAMWTSLAVALVIVVGAVGAFLHFRAAPSSAASAEKLSGYQAVFLTNGQVYFGKISNINNTYVTLKDIYYLQVNQQLQPGQGSTSTTSPSSASGVNSAANSQTQLSLVKLGNELHGPADSMSINRDQILFFEDLKQSGQVYQAIVKYQQSQASGSQTPAANTPAAGTTPPATNTPPATAPTTNTPPATTK